MNRPSAASAGQWHSSYEDCSKIKCAWGLGVSQIGLCHWSCCYSTVHDSHCRKSKPHVVADQQDHKESKQEPEQKRERNGVQRINVPAKVPRFIVELTDKPSKRWKHVCEPFLNVYPRVLRAVQQEIGTGVLETLVSGLMNLLAKLGLVL